MQGVFLEKTWLAVESDGNVLYRGFIDKGVSEVWIANKSFFIRMNRFANVSFSLNDCPLENAVKGEVPTEMRITHDSIEIK